VIFCQFLHDTSFYFFFQDEILPDKVISFMDKIPWKMQSFGKGGSPSVSVRIAADCCDYPDKLIDQAFYPAFLVKQG